MGVYLGDTNLVGGGSGGGGGGGTFSGYEEWAATQGTAHCFNCNADCCGNLCYTACGYGVVRYYVRGFNQNGSCFQYNGCTVGYGYGCNSEYGLLAFRPGDVLRVCGGRCSHARMCGNDYY